MQELFLFIICGWIIISAIAMGIVSYDCGNYGDITGRETKTSFGTCYVKTERGSIPRDELNFRAATHE